MSRGRVKVAFFRGDRAKKPRVGGVMLRRIDEAIGRGWARRSERQRQCGAGCDVSLVSELLLHRGFRQCCAACFLNFASIGSAVM